MTLSCDAALSDLVLQAAQQAAASPLGQAYGRSLPRVSERNRPLVPLLESLMDAAQAVASAITDNAWDESRPLDAEWVQELRGQTQKLAAVIHSASTCPDRTKELV
jgi:hypothetical protein